MARILRRTASLTAVIMAVSLLAPAGAGAQVDLPGGVAPRPSPTPSPSPTREQPPPPPPPAPEPEPEPEPEPAPTRSTPAPQPSSRPTSTATPRPQPSGRAPAPSGGPSRRPSERPRSGGARAKQAPAPVSPEVARAINEWVTRPKSPARTTTRLLELVAEAQAGGAVPNVTHMRRGFGRFPVLGYVWYQDDYGAPRYDPLFHPHEGTDIFAVSGTPVIAVEDGFIWKVQTTAIGGNSLWLMNDRGGYYYYGHLRGLAKGIVPGKRVKTGEVISFIGLSIDAQNTYPHVHFEIHPTGQSDVSVNPKPLLDKWLDAAEKRQMELLGYGPELHADTPFGEARWGTLFEMFADPAGKAPALWTAGLGGPGATVAYADLALADILTRTDFGSGGPIASGGAGDIASGAPADPLAQLKQSLTDEHRH